MAGVHSHATVLWDLRFVSWVSIFLPRIPNVDQIPHGVVLVFGRASIILLSVVCTLALVILGVLTLVQTNTSLLRVEFIRVFIMPLTGISRLRHY